MLNKISLVQLESQPSSKNTTEGLRMFVSLKRGRKLGEGQIFLRHLQKQQ